MTDPRPHHYRFVHRVLSRQVLEFGPRVTTPAPDGGSLLPVLTGIWDDLGQSLPPEDRLPSHGLDCRHLATDDHTMLLVTLPAPVGATEAHFAAAVHPRGAKAVRYLTLEHALNPFDGSVGTVLGEWTTESHLNHGPGPSPVAELFVAAVAELTAPKKRGFWRR
ncbi:hypothetical protein ACGF07_11500 [Kitasatospora sp. NPDC048194]|uniref:hypothetical protein n=1 Tax=Kitasatospora sp. NPDC048194 TaxID=3364045 RepID=UPI003715C149